MNSKSFLITGASVAAIALCGPMTAFAANKAASPTPAASPAASASPAAAASPAMKAPRAIPYRGTVASVDASAKSFTIAGKETSRVFMVTDKTVVTKAGAAATMSDIAANDAVRGSYWKQAEGKLEAKTVKIGEMTEAEKAATGKKSKKKTESADAGSDASAKASPAPSASPKKK
jgi:hypothetical protein